MKIIIREEQHRQRAVEAVKNCPAGYQMELKPYRESKTLEQLGYTFGAIYPAILKYIEESTGAVFTKEEIHDYLKKKALGPVYKDIGGELVEVVPKLSDKDSGAWSMYIERLEKYAYDRWGLIIPPPYYRE